MIGPIDLPHGTVTFHGPHAERDRASFEAEIAKHTQPKEEPLSTTLTDPATGALTRARNNLDVIEQLASLEPGMALGDDQRVTLGQWAGWGPMAKAFEPAHRIDDAWRDIAQRLRLLLAGDALDHARNAVNTAFYTSTTVMQVMWRIATELGIGENARVLEPGCGSGRFLSMAPFPVEAAGVELDPTSARIASVLHSDALIINKALQDVSFVDGSFDLVIGNVPFANVEPYDPANPDHGLSLHNYFLWRGMRALAPGGLLVAVTSRYTSDAASLAARSQLLELGEFVGAVRLPSGTFKSTGTSVVADIIVMRRNPSAPSPGTSPWLETVSCSPIRDTPRVNRYFGENPDQVVGQTELGSGMYGSDDITVTAPPNVEVVLAGAAVNVIRAGQALAPIERRRVAFNPVVDSDETRKLGSFHIDDGNLIQIVPHDESGVATTRSVGASKELKQLIIVRNAVLDLLTAEANPATSDATLMMLRRILNAVYDAYVAKWGPVNRCTLVTAGVDEVTGDPVFRRQRPPMGGFRQDPDFVTVLSIEDYDDDTGDAAKGPIFTQRVNRATTPVTSAATAADAIAISRDRHARIDLDLVASLLGLSEAETIDALDGLAYLDPETDEWVPADEYLSGNVRRKLAAARDAVKRDPRTYHANVAKLTEVQPKDLLPSEIKVRLGAPWVPLDDVLLFVSEVIAPTKAVANSVEMSREKVTARWTVKVARYYADQPSRWGTDRVSSYRLVEIGLNGGQPIVYDSVPNGSGGTTQVRNPDATLLACEKLADIQERFSTWVWEDPERTQRLARIYNDRFNSVVLPRYDGSYLTFPGMNAAFSPYETQLSMVAMNMAIPATGCGHDVGAGKTSIMAMTAMKLRETGLASKPVAIVPNHLVEQVAREIKALFPMARLLMASSEDTKKERRKLFAAKVATGDWDLVVMTHSAFTALPVSPELSNDYLAHQISRYEAALSAIDSTSGRAPSTTVKQLVKAIQKMRERQRKLMDHATDDGVTWEMLGIDYLMVDEAHYFKNLAVASSGRYAPSGSKRASDLDLKLWSMRNGHVGSGKRICMLLSGTLVSNSLIEMYVMQMYLQPERLRELEIDAFDAWAGSFVLEETNIEVAPDGGSFRMHTRPARFQNAPDLRMLFGEVVDIKLRDQMPHLARPQVEEHTEVIAPTDDLMEFVDSLVARADALRTTKVDPKIDNMLMVCNDGRKAALDLELVGVRTRDRGKIANVVSNVLATWENYRDALYADADGNISPVPGALQVVFCDLGTPHPDDAQVYGKIRDGLIAGGMPPTAIRFIHDAKTDAAKAQLFGECRAGHVAVLLGSTDKLGVGTNIQRRLVHLHHVDAPWRPTDVTQRNGRGDRTGNQNPKLRITRYIRERSFDAYMWQTLERKARFIAQVLTGDLTDRVVDDIGDSMTLSFGEVKALATGNPLVMDHAEANADVTRLRRLEAAHADTERDLVWSAEHAFAAAVDLGERAERCGDLANLVESSDDGWRTGHTGDRWTGTANIGREVIDRIGVLVASAPPQGTRHAGSYRGVDIEVDFSVTRRGDREISLWASLDGHRVHVAEVLRSWFKAQHHVAEVLDQKVSSAYFDLLADRYRNDAASAEERAEGLLAQRVPFPHAADLAAAEARLSEVTAAMAKTMDDDKAA